MYFSVESEATGELLRTVDLPALVVANLETELKSETTIKGEAFSVLGFAVAGSTEVDAAIEASVRVEQAFSAKFSAMVQVCWYLHGNYMYIACYCLKCTFHGC